MSSIKHSDEKLDGIDTIFLKCEHARRLMTVSSIWTFDHRLDAKPVYKILDKLCLDYPRFARVPRNESLFKTAAWTVPIGWSPQDNVVLHTLNKPTTQALQSYCSQQMTLPFDYTKPLWELHAISGLKGDQCAFFWKAHHAMSDGQGFIRSILSTTSIDAKLKRLEKQSVDNKIKQKVAIPRYTNKLPCFITTLFYYMWNMIYQAYVYSISLYHDMWVMLLCILPLRRKDLVYNGLQSYEKEMAWSNDIYIKDIKIVKEVFGGTLNDIMVSVITRSMKNYLESIGKRNDDYFHLIIPVSLRQPNDWSCHNVVSGNWGFFSMKDLDTGSLLKQVHKEMMAVKTSIVPRLLYNWVNLIWGYMPGITPPLYVYDYFCNIPHGLFTNVPGPTSPITFAGQQVQEYKTFPPQAGKGTIGIALISYCGKISIGAIADISRKYPDLAQGVCQRFTKEFNFILQEAKMELSKNK